MADREPLVHAGCDLRDFPFLPIEIGRLLNSRSWLLAKQDPQVGFYMINLWMRSLHQIPAASVEDDDLILAELAMCNLKVWSRVKDRVLRGWVKCTDGRLYHPVVAQKANEICEHRRNNKSRTALARRTLAAKRAGEQISVTDAVTELSLICEGGAPPPGSTPPSSSPPHPPNNYHPTSNPPTHAQDARAREGLFIEWYERYPHKVGRAAALKAYLKAIIRCEAAELLVGLDHYIRDKPHDHAWCNPSTWLNQDRWLDQPATPEVTNGTGIGGFSGTTQPNGHRQTGSKLLAAIGRTTFGREVGGSFNS